MGQSTIPDYLNRMWETLPKGRIPAKIFNDPAVYQLEKERLFSRAWVFLAHESEIPQPGDYVLRWIADLSVIVVRDEHGQVRAFRNACTHRGNQVCKAEMGNASHFRCSYHGWTFKNTGELIGVPYHREVYREQLNKSEWGLRPIRIDTYAGLIFGTLDPEADSLDEYLGGFQFYLDFFLKPGPEGTEVYGPPERWVADTDWKICAENFGGDGYHTPVAHQFGFALGFYPSTGRTHFMGYAVHIPGRGHCIGIGHTPGLPPFPGFPPEVVEGYMTVLSQEQISVFRDARMSVATVFPNLSFLIQPFSLTPGKPGLKFCTMRLWHPRGPGKIEMWTWCLVPKHVSPELKREIYRVYSLAFGAAGTFEQDDFENWTNLSRQNAAFNADNFELAYLQGLDWEPIPDFPGPGKAFTPYVTEIGFRNLWGTWLNYLLTPIGDRVDPARVPPAFRPRSAEPVAD